MATEPMLSSTREVTVGGAFDLESVGSFSCASRGEKRAKRYDAACGEPEDEATNGQRLQKIEVSW
jgi:hypothetical protein